MRTYASPAVLLSALAGYPYRSLPAGVTIRGRTLHLAAGTYHVQDVGPVFNLWLSRNGSIQGESATTTYIRGGE